MSQLVAGRYALDGVIGEGGLGRAFRATDRLSGDPVVLKVLHRDQGPEALMEEFAALRVIRHPRLVRARDFGWAVVEGVRRPYYAADWIDGDPLDRWWPSATRGARRAALVDVARALAALHRRGRRHGDVKPDNILVDGRGRATLIDLSCVAPIGAAAATLSGTPGYIAPELLDGRAADGRADLFALGVTWGRLAPSPEHVELVRRLSATEPSARPTGVEEVLEALGADAEIDAGGVRGAPFVGRGELLRRFDAWLSTLIRGGAGPRAFAIVGPPGSGRSRAFSELRWRAQLRLLTYEGRASRGVSELLARALGTEVGDGLEPQMAAVDALAGSDRAALLIMDDDAAAGARLARLVADAGPIGVMVTCDSAPDSTLAAPLAPLDADAIGAWATAAGVPDVDVSALVELTGGLPGPLADRLARAARGEDWRQPARVVPESSPPALRRAVAACAWLDRPSRAELDAVGVDEADRLSAEAGGWVLEAEGWVALAKVTYGPDLESLVAQLQDRLAPPRRAALALDAGRTDEAGRLADVWREEPRAWLDVLARLPDAARYARAAIAAGDLKRAEEALSRAVASDDATLARAELALKRARPEAVHEALRGVRGADAADLRARARLAQADYASARSIAEDALREEPSADPTVRRRLQETQALARGYLGDAAADARLVEIAAAHATAGDHAGQLRVTSYRGIVAFLRGDWLAAAERYEQALEVARAHALDDALATGWLNLGAARQEDGDWGGALEAYERGSRYARVLAQRGTEASLRFNLANLALEIGQLDRAATLANAARTRVDELGFRHLEIPLRQLGAEIALARGDLDAASSALAEAHQLAEKAGATRQVTELAILRAEVALRRGDLAAVQPVRPDDDDTDLGARVDLLAARAALAAGRSSEAVRRAERGLRAAQRAGRDLVAADAHAILARAYTETPELAAEHRAAARRAWQRIEATLPATYRDAFRAHPRRASILSEEIVIPDPSEARSTRRLRRFLEINRRIASLDTTDVLERAMDAAIELSQAERGFVLLRRRDTLEVAAARNLDRESVPSSHLKFSRTIAERVIAGDAPVITVDARADERFATERSVHAMRLQSVACVPIRGSAGVRGALYLDNRFERGRFGEGDVELLQAFADQVAIALGNAELHEALEARTKALDEAHAALEAQVEGQAAQITALASAVRDQQRALELRYDYGRIVGRGPKMRAVLETVERVIESDLSVLLRGESGTGKELVARAIHFNGPRKEGALVSLNCAALPANLIESELFGHVRGAFTGADRDKRGLFVEAEGGTLFLDEVGEMPLPMQAKLLRALQEREVRPVGSSESVPIDVRLLAATNRDLLAETRAGRFREDLYYRIGVIVIELPPLRERPEDLVALADHFLKELGGDKRLTPGALAALRTHGWPGNVRELSNVLARAHTMADSAHLSATDLGLEAPVEPRVASRADYLDDEAARIRRALVEHRWNVSRVSRELAIPRQTLYRRMQKLGLRRPR